jgi:outer membrane protein OmpA-like peptidoglycan-associated protein
MMLGLRVLGLGVGIPFAWLMGVGIAQLAPARTSQPPLAERMLRQTNRVLMAVADLPERWQQSPTQETRWEPVPLPTEPIDPLTQPDRSLTPAEKQNLEADLVAIAADLGSLNARLVDLETQLGRAQSTASLESRLAALKAALAAEPAPEAPVTPQVVADRPPAPEPDPLFQVSAMMVTLPSDALFVPGEARLLDTAPTILNSILTDLKRHPQATILIGSYTDNRMDAVDSRELSFQQAQALQTYLAGVAPPAVRWIPLGYGQSHPLTDNQSPESRQRNRRIEILVDTRR